MDHSGSGEQYLSIENTSCVCISMSEVFAMEKTLKNSINNHKKLKLKKTPLFQQVSLMSWKHVLMEQMYSQHPP